MNSRLHGNDNCAYILVPYCETLEPVTNHNDRHPYRVLAFDELPAARVFME